MIAAARCARHAVRALVSPKVLISAVARAMQPGCKVDTVLVLEGEQGIKKSSAIAALFGEEYTAESVSLFDQHNKMVMAMMGAWVVELAEFVAIARSHHASVKGLISMRQDKVVLPYARLASTHPRRCIFFGTINPDATGYLTDSTGNRRYWPVTVTKIDLEGIAAGATSSGLRPSPLPRAGERWWLEPDEERAAAPSNPSARKRTPGSSRCLLAANSPQLVDNIRAGRGVGEKLERRIREFMDRGDPGIAVRSGRSVVRKQRATIARNMAQAQVDASFRMTDETEQAKTFLRQQHLVVFNAEIVDPRALGMFRIGIRTVSREQLIETARRHGWKQG
jgi:hypothetical protein